MTKPESSAKPVVRGLGDPERSMDVASFFERFPWEGRRKPGEIPAGDFLERIANG